MLSWKEIIKEESKKPYYKNLMNKVKEDSEKYEIYPPRKDLFNAFNYCELNNVKAVILGQDPFINPGEAHGLCFSVKQGKIPPSLKNIFKELKADLNIDPPNHGDLTSWAKQGVLLLNSTLTVRRGESNSHQNYGWQIFTDKIISVINEKITPVVFFLWGNNARNKKHLISNSIHLILESAHPSPFSVHNGFFGSKPFSKANAFLEKHNIKQIDWKIK